MTIEKRICPACGKNTPGEYCDRCQKKFNEGFIALVSVDPEKSTVKENGTMTNENAYRTGELLFIKKESFFKLFDISEQDVKENYVFVHDEIVNVLKKSCL